MLILHSLRSGSRDCKTTTALSKFSLVSRGSINRVKWKVVSWAYHGSKILLPLSKASTLYWNFTNFSDTFLSVNGKAIKWVNGLGRAGFFLGFWCLGLKLVDSLFSDSAITQELIQTDNWFWFAT